MNNKHPFVTMGLIGFLITLALNIFNHFVLGVGGDAWWSLWFPGYVVWFVFLVIGVGLSRKNRTGLVNRRR